MAEESDGIEEALEGQIRVLVTAAGRIGEQFARAREEASRRAQAVSEREARELSSRFDAERNAARTEYANVYRNDWWDKATPEQIAGTYQAARAWANEDPEAVRAEARMRDELSTRYGVDVSNTGSDPAAVQAALGVSEPSRDQPVREQQVGDEELTRAKEWFASNDPQALSQYEQRRRFADTVDAARADDSSLVQTWKSRTDQTPERDADAERRRAAAEEAEAVRLVTEADRADSAAEESRTAAQHEPDPEERQEARVQAETHQAHADSARADARPLYDSAERRQATAADLESKGISPEAVGAKMRADVSQAKPATEAAKGGPAKSPKARKTRSGRGAEAQRSGQSR